MSDLKDTSSPYLQRFADSEVDWHVYSDATIQKAIEEERPLHISMGRFDHPNIDTEVNFYRDKRVALSLNEWFVNVKLDADLRPDVEQTLLLPYESFARTEVGRTSSNYPVSVIVDPESELEMGAGYSSKIWENQAAARSDLPIPINIGTRAESSEQEESPNKPSRLLIFDGEWEIKLSGIPELEQSQELAQLQRQQILALADTHRDLTEFMLGGWIKQLLQLWQIETDKSPDKSKALDLVLVTLTQWVRSRDFDHMDGGVFHHQRWQWNTDASMPKTLAANAFALELLTEALTITKDSLLADIARELSDFVLEKFASDEGPLVTSVMNESNRYGTVQRHKVKRLLTEDEYLLVGTLYGLDRRANWHGHWMLERQGSWRSVVDQMFFNTEECESLLQQGMSKLKEEEERDAVYRVDKRLFFRPNGQMIFALFRLARALGEDKFAVAANKLLRHLIDGFWIKEQGLICQSDGSSEGITLLDFALLIRVLMVALERSWNSDYAVLLNQLVSLVHERYWLSDERIQACNRDKQGVLYALPSSDRSTEPQALPIVRQAFQIYGTLFNHDDSLRLAQQLIATSVAVAKRLASGIDHSVTEALRFRQGETTVILRGPEHLLTDWVDEIRSVARAWWHVFAIPYTESKDLPSYLPRMMVAEERERVVAYIAHDSTVYEPIHDLAETIEELEAL